MIKYHQIRQNLFEEVSLHPEILKNMEILHYHVENNFPVEKEVIIFDVKFCNSYYLNSCQNYSYMKSIN